MDLNVVDEVRRRLDEALKRQGVVNIVIAGRTGVGKSTLVNAVFQGNLATTGQGRPVTTCATEYTKADLPVLILDTRGLEMDRFAETAKLLEVAVRDRATDTNATRHLHVAWVCFSEDSRRVEAGETAVVEMLARYMPVIAVVTKARADRGFRAEVQRLLPAARNVVPVRALREVDDEGHVLEPRGLVDLVNLTQELVPEAQRNAFAAAQRISIELKRNRAQAAVVTSASLAAAAGASPIPFSDAMVIVPIQIGMLATITAIFGLKLSEGFLSTLLASASGSLAATFVGQAIVSGLLKLVPGPGTIAGGAISAATAASLTSVLGGVYVAVLTRLFRRNGSETPTEQEVTDAFREELRSVR